MKKTLPLIIAGLIFLTAIQTAAFSKESESEKTLPPGITSFLRQWATAIEEKDPRGLKKLIHPEIIAAFSDKNRDFFDYILSHELLLPLTGEYRVEDITPYTADLSPLLADVFDYPVTPAYRLKIAYTAPGGETIRAVRDLVRDNGSWYLVYPVPDRKSLLMFRDSKAAELKEKELAALLYRKLDDALKIEMEELATAGKLEEAALLYSRRTGHCPDVSLRVAELAGTAGSADKNEEK